MSLLDTLINRLVKFVGGAPERDALPRERAIPLSEGTTLTADDEGRAETEADDDAGGEADDDGGGAESPEPEQAPRPDPVELDPEVEALISSTLAEVPKVIGVAVVDLSTGKLLGLSTTEALPAGVVERVAAATCGMFAVQHFAEIEREPLDSVVRQVIVSSANALHVLLRIEGRPEAVLVVVCRGDANLGLVLTRARGRVLAC